MLKYFFSGPESDFVSNGNLICERLGEAGVALSDCLKIASQCSLSVAPVACELGPGVILDPLPADGTSKARPGFDPAYKWLAFESGRAGVQSLIGYRPEDRFSPAMVQRRLPVSGAVVSAFEDSEDGLQEWMIPLAMNGKDYRGQPNPFGRLNTVWFPVAKRDWERRISSPEHKAIWDFANEVKQFLAWYPQRETLGPRPEWENDWYATAAMRILGLNYRVGRPEWLVMEALNANPMSTAFAVNVLHAFTGYSEYDAWRQSAAGKSPAAA